MDKIQNTFNRTMDQIEKYSKVYREGGKLEQAVAQDGGDIAWFKDIRDAIEDLMHALEEAQMSHGIATTNEAVTESNLTEGVLDSDDDDGFMARSQLYFMARDAIQLHGMIDDRDNLPGWVQSKISQSAEAIDAVRRYTEYNAMKADVPAEMPQQELPAQAPAELEEGTWALPDTMQKAKELVALMNNPIPVEKAADLLYSLVGDDSLFDSFYELEDEGPGTDARPTVARWIADNMDLIAANVDDQEVIKALADVAELHEGALEEGKLANYALAALLGLGAIKGLDATSAKHTPLGQALNHAAETWSGPEAAEAEELLSNIDLYADEGHGPLRHWAKQNQDLINQFKESTDVSEAKKKQRLDPKCWDGYKIGNPKTKMKGDTRVNNCVPESVNEAEEKPYICVHAKKGKHECHAGSSYEAAKKAAAHWKLKSTAGIDAHLALDEGMAFDEKRNGDLKSVATDMFAKAKAEAKKSAKARK